MDTQITVTTDPARPLGGFARLSVPNAALSEETAPVSVFDPYSQRYLGRDDFQGEPVQFGPYPVERDGDLAWVTVGPEIVNQIEEFAKLKLTVGGVSGQVDWPDDVVPAFGAARLGDIFSAASDDGPKQDANLVGKMPKEPTPEPEPQPEPAPPEPTPDPEPVTEPGTTSKMGLIIGLLLAALAVAAAVYFLVLAPGEILEPEPEPTPVVEPVAAPEPEPAAVEPPADPCAEDIMNALGDLSFAEARQTMTSCAARMDPDRALSVLESAAEAGEADALLRFGKAYDGDASDPEFEDTYGVTFGDLPAQAAEYYKRAVDAGATEATELLQGVCNRLSSGTGTVERSAYQDWCS